MKYHHSSGKYRMLKRVIMMCLALVLVCSMSISAFAVNSASQVSEQTAQTQEQKREVEDTGEKKSHSTQAKEKSSESTTKTSTESQKSESEEKKSSEEKTEAEKDTASEQKSETAKKEETTTEKSSEEEKTEAEKEKSSEATTEAAAEKTTENTDKKKETSEQKADDDKNIAVMSISGPTTVKIGESITLKGTTGYSYNSWSSSNNNTATVSGNGASATVTGVAVGTVTITHYYSSSRWGNQQTETYSVTVKFQDKHSGDAAIYYLANPTGDPWTNDTGAWAPETATSDTIAQINTAGATWEDGYVGSETYKNKNIKTNVASYITSWPDGSTGSTWTVKRGDTATGTYFTTVLESIWENYKTSVATELDISADLLSKTDISEITLTPRKISRDNAGEGASDYQKYHIDCALSIKSTRVFTAKFWVKEPGASEYTQVDAKNYMAGRSIEETTQAIIGSTEDVKGVTYVLDGWYRENSSGGAYGSKVDTWKYTPTTDELADGTVNFYAHYTPTTTSIKLKKLVTGNMGDKQKKFKFTISVTSGTGANKKNETFTIGSDSKTGSATEELKDQDEITITKIPVGANVTITEDEYKSTSYAICSTSYTIDDETAVNGRIASIANIQAKDDASASHEVVFTNNKDAIPDTGITTDSTPFITLLALCIAGIAGYLFFKGRERLV